MAQNDFIKLIDLKRRLDEKEKRNVILNLAIHYYLLKDYSNCVRVLSEIDNHLKPEDVFSISRKKIYQRIKLMSNSIH